MAGLKYANPNPPVHLIIFIGRCSVHFTTITSISVWVVGSFPGADGGVGVGVLGLWGGPVGGVGI